ncbi:MAG TPA: penicillin acylase family protein [Anaerolineales bacterium]|nr:penicillin acylase family protein [Anaerolineales bacterium]
MRNRFEKAQVVIGSLLFGVALLAVFWVGLSRFAFPPTQGTLHLPGLDGPVTVYRDGYGIPHIYAATAHDLFFAQGYLHAQDRFWQMDTWRHIGRGRLAEMFGESQVETDAFLRTLGWERLAEQEFADLPAEDKAILQAYADGVNAYLKDHTGAALSLEYVVLGLTNPDYRPAPWRPTDTLVWAKVMAWDLRSNMKAEIQRAILLGTLTPEQVADLFPEYPFDRHPVIVPELSGQAHGTSAPVAAPDFVHLRPLFETVSQHFAAVDAWTGPTGAGVGSNNWVIAGSRTATGMPFLANDPHLSAQIPSIWYEVGLHCEQKTPDCLYELNGFSFAGAPGVVIGHNDRIAWGFTNVGSDVADLYIEKINPENPYQYEVNGQWVDMEVRREVLQVAGGEPVELEVRLTRHGPIISDTYGKLKDFAEKAGVEVPQHYAIALRWTALQPSRTIHAILAIDRAQNWEEFRQAVALFDVPAQNMVYADVEGHIGYQTPGLIPIRRQGHDGTLPVPGWTDDYEWQGFIPFDELPHVFDPPKGYIATANNAVVGPDYLYPITKDWDYGYRAQRIVDLIEAAPAPVDAAYIARMQMDNYDASAAFLVPLLQQVDLQDEHLRQRRALFDGWDFQMDMDSASAALYAAFWNHLLADTFRDELPEKYWPEGGSRWFEVVYRLVQRPDSPWWDDKNTPAVETRDDILRRAFAEAVDELEARFGPDPRRWAWGKMHTLTLRNQTLGKSGIAPIEAFFNRGPYPTSGSGSIINATSWDARKGYEVSWLPSMRMIVDLSDLSRSLTIHTTGESGHAYHPHYVDMTDMWRLGQYHPMLWTRAQVEAAAETVLRLEP